LSVKLETGRTHQIRVHLSHLHYPIVGDPVYGGRLLKPRGASAALLAELHIFRRQALHAASLGFEHPRSAKAILLQVDPPQDFAHLLDVLRADAREMAAGETAR
jgi:23S rRNA pseudouridine1911/1915/1917 synthase